MDMFPNSILTGVDTALLTVCPPIKLSSRIFPEQGLVIIDVIPAGTKLLRSITLLGVSLAKRMVIKPQDTTHSRIAGYSEHSMGLQAPTVLRGPESIDIS